jgi:RND family efflux transporter MFP subunit
MINLFTKAKAFVGAHKIASGVMILILGYGGYHEYEKRTSTEGVARYVLGTVTKGTIISSLSGSGQVATSNQVDLKSKVSGDLVSISIAEGRDVSAGEIIARIDSVSAQKAVRDAEVSLESAKIALQKIQKPADSLAIIQSQNSLDRAKNAKQNAADDLEKAYSDSYNTIANAFLDLPGIMSGLHDILFQTNSSLGGTNVQNIDFYTSTIRIYDEQKADLFGKDANTKYQTALAKYNKSFQDYKGMSRTADKAAIETMLDETYDTGTALSETIKSTNNLIQFYGDQLTQHNLTPAAVANTQLATLNTYTGKANTHITNLLNARNTIKNDKNTITDSDRTISETTASLAKLEAGTDPLDIQTSALSVKQRENALIDAREALSNYTIRAPFGGTIAKVNVKRGDSVSSGTAIGTLIAKQKIAQISLNEIDAAKTTIGQKATLTFDAVDGLSISGIVGEIDTIGTVTQGVVTYIVKISFDTQDQRIKAGMSVNASIITDVKSDVLTVPNSAVKTRGDTHYVQMFDSPLPAPLTGVQGSPSAAAPREQPVEIGISNDTTTEILSGLSEGESVVTKTISGATTATPAPSAASILGGNRGGGGFRGN